MVQQAFNDIEHLKAEVKRLRGKLDSIAIGNQVILNPNAGQSSMPPPASGALIYGTAAPEWGRRAIGAEGDVLQVQSGFPVWDVPPASALPTGGATGQALVKDSATDGDATWHDIEDLATADTDTSKVLKPDGAGGVAFGAAPAGTPSATVEDETTYGISPSAGSSTDYSRGDHTHGSPPAPINFNPDDPPSSPDSMDDEFSGGGSIDAKWTKVNDPAGADALNQTDFEGYLHVGLSENTGTDNLASHIQLYQTTPTGTQTLAWIAKVAIDVDVDAWQTEKGEFASVHLYLMDSVNSLYVASGITISNFAEASSFYGFAQDNQDSGTFTNTHALTYNIGEFIYLKLVKSTANAYTSANTYIAYASRNGIIWNQLGTVSKTFTGACDRVGLKFRRPKSQNGAPHAESIVDFFRRID